MFFFGAFSGNLIYLILILSYLAGCSAMVMRGGDSKVNGPDDASKTSTVISYNNQLPEVSFLFKTDKNSSEQQAITEKSTISPPVCFFSRSFHFPPLLPGKSNFPGSIYFSRPPPLIG